MSLLNSNLKTFLAIVRSGTVIAAAKDIGLSQTGVTQRIRALENSLGISLFTRSRKGMNLTSEGQELLHFALKAEEIENEAQLNFAEKGSQKTIRINISAPSTVTRSRVLPHINPVLKKFDNLTFTFNITDNESALRYLKSGKSQFTIIPKQDLSNELDFKTLSPEIYFLYGHKSWKNRDLKEIVKTEKIVDFSNDDDLTINFLKKYRLTKLVNPDRHYVNNIDALTQIICSGSGYSVLSESFVKQFYRDSALIKLNKEKQMNLEFVLAWYPRDLMPSYFSEIVSAIK